MMKILKGLKETLRCMTHPIESIDFIRSSFHHFILQGGVEIETAFRYPEAEDAKTYSFRTIIQIDADIINFVPDPDLHPDSPGWQKAFWEAYGRHRDNLGHFLAQLDRIRIIPWIISTAISSLSVLSLWKVDLSEKWPGDHGWVYLVIWPFLAYLVRRYALGVFVRFSTRSAVAWLKRRWQSM
jgi:hypothetical protein